MKENKNNQPKAPKEKKPSKLVAFLKSRNAKRGSLAIAITAIFIAIVIGVNIVVGLLGDRFDSLSVDLTSNDAYKLTDDSLDHLAKFKKDVTIYVLAEEQSLEAQGEYYVQVNKLLGEFEKNSKNIKLKYVNLTKNPTFTTSYPDLDWQNQSYLLVVEHGDEYLGIANEDIFTYDEEMLSYGEEVVSGQNVEQAVLTAMLRVTTEEKIGVTVLGGHGEIECDALTSLLSNNAYDVETISLLNGKISEKSQFVILFAPAKDIDEDTYNTLVDWLHNDGNYGRTLLYVPNDKAPESTPYIDSLLEDWGMEVKRSYLFETDTQYMTNTPYPNLFTIVNYDNTDFSNGLKDTSIPVVMMYCMPIELIDSAAVSLLSSSEAAVEMPLTADENWDYNEEEPKKLIGAAISTKGNEDETKSSNVIVFGSYDSLGASALGVSTFNNAEYVINLFNTIAERDDATITVEGKTLESEELGITSTGTSIALGVVFRYLVPLMVLVIGIIVLIRRRHK
ncbi:MAG: Gldg family protein [Ruminococcus sp.]|nr:Gldg family protein [Ruminococcus sp.]